MPPSVKGLMRADRALTAVLLTREVSRGIVNEGSPDRRDRRLLCHFCATPERHVITRRSLA